MNDNMLTFKISDHSLSRDRKINDYHLEDQALDVFAPSVLRRVFARAFLRIGFPTSERSPGVPSGAEKTESHNLGLFSAAAKVVGKPGSN